jgi:hypothetical protein
LLNGLKEALPQIIDKSSRGGSLLDNAGGLLGMAKKLFCPEIRSLRAVGAGIRGELRAIDYGLEMSVQKGTS